MEWKDKWQQTYNKNKYPPPCPQDAQGCRDLPEKQQQQTLVKATILALWARALTSVQAPSTCLCETLTWRVLLPLRGSGQRAEIGGWPGASSLCLCFVQVLQEPGCLVQVQVALIVVQLLLHFPYVTNMTQCWLVSSRLISGRQGVPITN